MTRMEELLLEAGTMILVFLLHQTMENFGFGVEVTVMM